MGRLHRPGTGSTPVGPISVCGLMVMTRPCQGRYLGSNPSRRIGPLHNGNALALCARDRGSIPLGPIQKRKPFKLRKHYTIMNILCKIFLWSLLVVTLIVLLPLLLFIFLILWLCSSSKCKYYKRCKHADKEAPCCTEDCGMYYSYDKPAGCYIQMAEKEDKTNNAKSKKSKKK